EVSEVEPNDLGSPPVPFTPGATLRGRLTSAADQDWWSFTGVAGQTIVAQLTPDTTASDGFLRLFAGGSAVANRCALSHFPGGFAVGVSARPGEGASRPRVLGFDGTDASDGSYRIDTAWHPPAADDHARDHRDVLYSRSDNGGATWTVPVVLSDAPPWFD